MSVATTPAPPAEAFELSEHLAAPLEEASVQPDGTVTMHLIRPCLGEGKGRHIYPAEMLRESAQVFSGWKMYVDHRSEAAKRAAQGLPRSVRDLAGRVVESWWDSSVPAEGRFQQGAVVGRVRPVGVVRELIQEDPELLEASINARATSVRQAQAGGRQAWLVEGIEPKGSVDYVTEGGAGGRVAQALVEAYHDGQIEEMALLETLSDQELLDHVRDRRPALVEAITAGSESVGQPATTPEPPAGTDKETTVTDPAQVLREALESEEGREVLDSHINGKLEEARAEDEQRLGEERELIRAEARADSDRRIQIRDLEREAHSRITEAKLPDAFAGDLRERFSLRESGDPSPDLNVFDEVDPESGRITKSAKTLIREAVDEQVRATRDKIASVAPTEVEGQGGGAPDDGSGGGRPSAKDPLWKRQLREAGEDDPDAAYDPDQAVPTDADRDERREPQPAGVQD